ncbi:putative membrane protein [Paraburkholderia sp. Kb1A]|nr:putative membrane protein [Paraburkholderia sp. Kb1A]
MVTLVVSGGTGIAGVEALSLRGVAVASAESGAFDAACVSPRAAVRLRGSPFGRAVIACGSLDSPTGDAFASGPWRGAIGANAAASVLPPVAVLSEVLDASACSAAMHRSPNGTTPATESVTVSAAAGNPAVSKRRNEEEKRWIMKFSATSRNALESG